MIFHIHNSRLSLNGRRASGVALGLIAALQAAALFSSIAWLVLS